MPACVSHHRSCRTRFAARITWSWVLLALMLAPQVLSAGTADDRLRAFLSEVKTLQADFEQVVLDEQQKELQRGVGMFVVRRPGQFRWDYYRPYQQLIVADGERIWVYDPELEQVTVKPQDETLSDTPAMLLSGGQPIDESFEIKDLGSRDGLEWLELYPKQQEGNFERLRLGFAAQDLKRMEMVDGFGQLTIFTFSRIKRNLELGDSLFQFHPRPGVDVIGE